MIRRTLFFAGIISFLFVSITAWARAEDDIQWSEIKTRHTIIRYQSLEDLNKLNKNLKYSSFASASGLQLLYSKPGSSNSKNQLKRKVDAIFKRVQVILDMRKKVERVKVNLYRDKAQLNDTFYKLQKKQGHFRAWYIYEFNTIYINITDIHKGILAHEMAHSIIDHYLAIRPPAATAEILARYVESHL